MTISHANVIYQTWVTALRGECFIKSLLNTGIVIFTRLEVIVDLRRFLAAET